MTLKLRDLIRSVRECKTAAEERTIIAKECAEIRASFSATDSTTRHRNISKLIVCNPFVLISFSSLPEEESVRCGLVGRRFD